MSFFDGTNVDESVLDALNPIPEGTYRAVCMHVEKRASKNDSETLMYRLELMIIDQEHKDHKLIDHHICKHSNEAAQKLGLARMLRAVKVLTNGSVTADIPDLIGKCCKVKVACEKDDKGRIMNRILEYLPDGPTQINEQNVGF